MRHGSGVVSDPCLSLAGCHETACTASECVRERGLRGEPILVRGHDGEKEPQRDVDEDQSAAAEQRQ